MSLETIKPINTKILFQFVEDIENSAFHSKSAGGIHLIEDRSNQVNQDRWGKVLKLGPDVDTSLIQEGEYILIEALGWTNAMTLTDAHDAEKFWFTDFEKVVCVTEENPVAS
jgi:hypothetical protein